MGTEAVTSPGHDQLGAGVGPRAASVNRQCPTEEGGSVPWGQLLPPPRAPSPAGKP